MNLLHYFSVALAFVWLSPVSAQISPVGDEPPPGGPGNHICAQHPVTDHDNGWRRISIADGPTIPVVTLDNEEWVLLHSHTESNSTNQNVTVTISFSKTSLHSCSVGGKITIGGSVEAAAGALFANCKATATAEVELNALYSSSYSETVTIESSTIIPPGKVKSYKAEKLRKDASGALDTYDHKIVCRNIPVGSTTDEARYCNKTTLSGGATGYGATMAGWTESDVQGEETGPPQ